MAQELPIKIGDVVRIRGTPATLAAELAGLVGQVKNIADPCGDNIEVIGLLADRDVYQVYFEQRGDSFWLAAPLLLLDQPTKPLPIDETGAIADGKSNQSSAAPAGPVAAKAPTNLRRLMSRIERLIKRSLRVL